MNYNKVYFPGEVICEVSEDRMNGRGTYVQDGRVIAAIVGRLTVSQTKAELVNYHDDE